jgi:hypothetical protein
MKCAGTVVLVDAGAHGIGLTMPSTKSDHHPEPQTLNPSNLPIETRTPNPETRHPEA